MTPIQPSPHSSPFDRQVVALLGLPFDVLDMAQAVGRVRQAAHNGQRCFISTPNLNFLVSAQSDATFRDSVLHSDLSLVDGMPLVWISKLLQLPIRERVPGSGLFEQMGGQLPPPVRVYFFGGQPGVAQRAHERVNQNGQRGLVSVGYADPGSGDLQTMSAKRLIDAINLAEPQFLVVALGAKKGQRWIEHNLSQLHAPVVSHLGAVVNFVAGTLNRAPERWQQWGLEWVWRIKEEPALWRRYWHDGCCFLGLVFTRVLPHALAVRSRHPDQLQPAQLLQEGEAGGAWVLRGAWTSPRLRPLREAFASAVDHQRSTPLILDLSQVSHVDSHFIGLMMLARGVFRGGLTLRGAPPKVAKIFHYHVATYLLSPATGD